MSRRVLVTGGAGFIGSHVADSFLAAGWDVTVLDNLSRGRRANVSAAASFHALDAASAEARELVRTGRFEVITHLAAQVDVRVSVKDPVKDAQDNLIALLNLLVGAQQGGVRRVVFSSSGGVVYGEGTPPHPETAPKLPVSPYGVAKLSSEYYLAAWRVLYGLESVALRYANVYGPRQDPHGEAGVVAIFGNRLRERRAITIYGDGNQTRDYVYVGDVARANLLAADAALPAPDGTIDAWGVNIGTGRETSVNELARAMIRSSRVEVPIEHAPARTGELLASAVTIDKAARVLSWRPEVTLAEGLARTYAWIVEDAA